MQEGVFPSWYQNSSPASGYLWKSDSSFNFQLFWSKTFWQKVGIVNQPLHHIRQFKLLLTAATTPFLWSYKAINNGSSPSHPERAWINIARLFLQLFPAHHSHSRWLWMPFFSFLIVFASTVRVKTANQDALFFFLSLSILTNSS